MYRKLCELKWDVSAWKEGWLSLYSEEEPLRRKRWTITNQLKEIALSASDTLITSNPAIATQRGGGTIHYWTGSGCGLPRGDGVIETLTAVVWRGRWPLYPWQRSTGTVKAQSLKTKITVQKKKFDNISFNCAGVNSHDDHC